MAIDIKLIKDKISHILSKREMVIEFVRLNIYDMRKRRVQMYTYIYYFICFYKVL